MSAARRRPQNDCARRVECLPRDVALKHVPAAPPPRAFCVRGCIEIFLFGIWRLRLLRLLWRLVVGEIGAGHIPLFRFLVVLFMSLGVLIIEGAQGGRGCPWG